MKIQDWIIHPYNIPMMHGQMRSGVVLEIRGPEGHCGWGEIAPLPNWSRESLEQALDQLFSHKHKILDFDWSKESLQEGMKRLTLYPSVEFGLESALLSLTDPLPPFKPIISAFFLGSAAEVVKQAEVRKIEGFTSAKLKVGHLQFAEAKDLIHQLKGDFRLRVDVNRAWDTVQSLNFFSQFERDAFDYVEEPFQNPIDLHLFIHPLAVDESFPGDLSLKELEKLPNLKALIYKPTLQGGLLKCLPLHQWLSARGIELVLSSSYESAVGLRSISNLAQRLKLQAPLGIGTYQYMLLK